MRIDIDADEFAIGVLIAAAVADLRAALLALAHMELPTEVIQAATRACEEGGASEFLDNLFKAMLHAIIEEPK